MIILLFSFMLSDWLKLIESAYAGTISNEIESIAMVKM